MKIKKDFQIIKFAGYGFFKNLRFFDPFIILFFREQQITYLQIGILYSFREISNAVLEIPTGWVADSWGRKYSLMLAFLSYILAFIIFFVFHGFLFYFFAMFFYSLGDALRSGTHKAIIMSYLKIKGLNDKKVHYYGFTRSWSQRGSALSAILAGIMVIYTKSYRYVFLASVVPYIIDFILIASYPNYLNGSNIKRTDKQSFSKIFKQTINDFFAIFKQKKIPLIFINSSVYDGLYKAIKDYIQPIIKSYSALLPIVILKNENNSVILLSLTYFVLYLLSAYSSQYSYLIKQIFIKSEKAINQTFSIGVAFLLIASVFYLFNLKLIAILFYILFYMVQNIRRPLIVEVLSNKIKGTVLASGLSAESFLKMITTVIFSMISGYFADLLGIGYSLLIVSSMALFLIFFIKIR